MLENPFVQQAILCFQRLSWPRGFLRCNAVISLLRPPSAHTITQARRRGTHLNPDRSLLDIVRLGQDLEAPLDRYVDVVIGGAYTQRSATASCAQLWHACADGSPENWCRAQRTLCRVTFRRRVPVGIGLRDGRAGRRNP